MIYEFSPTFSTTVLQNSALVVGFGREQTDFNWSLLNLRAKGDEKKSENQELVKRLGFLARRLGINCYLAPHPTRMNSEIASARDLSSTMRIPNNKYTSLQRGQYADGVRIESKRQAFIMSAADCALVIVRWRDQVWAAHAGRDSLIDRTLIATGSPGKRYRSVVDSIMYEIPRKFWDETQVYCGCTISPGEHFEHSIDHPEHGEFNKKMLDYIAGKYYGPKDQGVQTDGFRQRGQIDMRELIRRQFECYGVTKFEEGKICTFSDRNADGTPMWYSNVRATDEKRRNLFLVVRN